MEYTAEDFLGVPHGSIPGPLLFVIIYMSCQSVITLRFTSFIIHR